MKYDYIIIGSGFGGSVAALRLTQKGYKVAVIEAGKRWRTEDFTFKNWNLRKFLFLPKIGCYGIQRLNFLKDVFIISGAGVGGGSLVYANTLYVPGDDFFSSPSAQQLGGKEKLLPFYELAKSMLGVTQNPLITEQDKLMKAVATDMGKGDTFQTTPVGVYFGKAGEEADDPFFEGEGPARKGCTHCGKCMTGCDKNAKNTLDKNYLYFAEKLGAEVIPEHTVVDVLTTEDQGYRIKARKTTGSGQLEISCKGVIYAAGALGTNNLLLKLRTKGSLPDLPDGIGDFVRTNSESIITVKSNSKTVDYTKGVAITSSVHPDDQTHIEPVRYGMGDDLMGAFVGMSTTGDGLVPRWLKATWKAITHPIDFLNLFNPFDWARTSFVLLVMQTVDNHINLRRKRRWIWPFSKSITSEYGSDKRNPTWIPKGLEFAKNLAKRTNGTVYSVRTENLMNAPLTAHIMGGCSIKNEVIDEQNRLKGYPNMWVVDGAQIPENLGVNPSLSITALAERAMSMIPTKDGCEFQHLKVEAKWGIRSLVSPDQLVQK
ncbi:MAG: GMC family oxidoreductase [Cyclobacteriaceae bacterium]